MASSRFDVNDADLRESFLRLEVPPALDRLEPGSCARWGGMQPQEMVEHLIWALEISTGQARTECPVPEAVLPRMKKFLYDNRPTPQGFMNPALVSGLPPLRFESLSQAKVSFARELGAFLDRQPSDGTLHTHPIFGPIGYDEWHRSHYKHMHHHLLQFGLIEG